MSSKCESLGSDINSHHNVFNCILDQISGNSDYEIPFLHLLQHLLSIEYKSNELTAIVWDSAQTLVERATTSIKSKEDAELLLKLIEKRKTTLDMASNGSNGSIDKSINPKQINGNTSISIPPPPPPPLPSISLTLAPPPPPPPPPVPIAPMMNGKINESKQYYHLVPDLGEPVLRNKNKGNESPILSRKLPQQEIPKPKTRMKSINWCKIPSEKIVTSSKPNLWTLVATQHESDYHLNVDFNELEDLFRQPSNSSAPNSCPGSPRMQRRPVSSEIVGSPFNSLERKVIKRQSGEYQLPNELQLLDGKKSLNVNIFLKQYKESTEELVNKIIKGEHKEIGTERLKNLLKILPEPNEIDLLKKNQQESHRMPIAEKFLLNVINIRNYKLKIEAMLLKEEFESNVTYLEPSIEAVKKAAKEIKESKSLHELFYLILISGNFLNSGGYAGDAAGFKIMSLLKLPEIRANKAGVNLIHYVAMQADKRGLCNFAQELPSLEEASKVSIENLKIEVNCLSNKIEKLKEQIDKQNEDSVHKEMISFLDSSDKEVKKLSVAIEKQLNEIRIEMADFLCEDVERFKLEECFRILSSFCQRFKLAVDENERRRDNEMKLEARKSNSHLKKWTQSSESDNFLIENSLTQSNSSNCLTSSLNSSLNCDTKLKRRSRRGSQDDELHNGLLEFLKTANDMVSSDIPIFGGSLRRMGSGRRSRSSNTITDNDLNNRERNITDLRATDRIDEMETNQKSNQKFNKMIQLNTDSDIKNTNLFDGESDDESNRRRPFDRFSPLRRTIGYKPSELESRFTKRFDKTENYPNFVKTDRNNNQLNECQNSEQKLNEKTEQIEKTSNPIQLRQYWSSKQIGSKDTPSSTVRPTTLHLPNRDHNSQQPTAIITPTKVIRNEDNTNTELLSPVLALETDRINRLGCLPRRTSQSSPSNATAAAIVTPIQINEKPIEKESISSSPLKSRLPVRKAPLTPLPVQRKNGQNQANRTGIPFPSKNTHKNTNNRTTNQIPNARTYRSPSTVSRTNLTSDKGSMASIKRSAQILPSRSFMKQTSSSAAKTRNNSKY